MTGGDPELAADVDLRNTQQQLQVFEALTVATKEAHAALDAMMGAPNPESARQALEQRFGFTEIQATAVLEMQFRRVTAIDRQKIEQRRQELADRVQFLQAELGES